MDDTLKSGLAGQSASDLVTSPQPFPHRPVNATAPNLSIVQIGDRFSDELSRLHTIIETVSCHIDRMAGTEPPHEVARTADKPQVHGQLGDLMARVETLSVLNNYLTRQMERLGNL